MVIECAMLFNYKSVNYSGIKTVDMIFNISQNNISFMSTVDKYNYNIINDTTDCAMIIYSGEVDSPKRPLLILADYPIPSNLENNYFIFPFFKGGNYFKGVLIDIRFINTNNGKPNYNVKIFVNDSSIIEERNITDNVIIPVKGSDDKLDCGNNLQCSLKINIIKIKESDPTFNFTINVYSQESTIPEIIDNTQSTNKLYISKGGSKTIKIDIGKDEEAEIEINYNNVEGKMQAKLIQKSQVGDQDIYIFTGDSSNLLNFVSNNRKITITKEQSNKCYDGCELVLLIKMDENINNDYGEVSITKSSLTQEPTPKQENDSGKKVDAWLTAVLCIVCAIVVAGILILVYFLVLKKKNNNNNFKIPINRSYVVNQKPPSFNNYGNYTNAGNSIASSNRQFNNYNNAVNNNALNKLNNNYSNNNIGTNNVNYNIARNNYNNISNNNFKSNLANNNNNNFKGNVAKNYNNNLGNNFDNNLRNNVNNIPNNKANN